MKKTILLVAVIMLATLSFAQTTVSTQTSSNSLFTASAGPIAINLNGRSNVGVENINSLAITKSLTIEETNLLATGASLTGFYGGASYTTNFDKWLSAHTVLPKQTFGFYGRFAAGTVQNTMLSKSHFSTKVAGGILYDPTHGGQFTITAGEIGYINAPGFGKKPNGWTAKTGIAWNF